MMLEGLKINRKLLKDLDFILIIAVVLLVGFSTLNIYSATKLVYGKAFLKNQLIGTGLGFFIVYVLLIIDYKVIKEYATLLYIGGVIFLLINQLPMFKHVVNGAASWVKFGPITLQPSEFAKVGLMLMLAKQLDNMEGEINNLKNFMKLTFFAAIPMALIVIQPDMGMTMVCFFIVLGIYFLSGINMKIILGGFFGGLTTLAIVWNSPLMQTYWKNRIISFLNPAADELGSGYQLAQSKIAIGSGGLLGRGLFNGIRVAGKYIPEVQTDFIFAVVGEEWGFIGALFVLTLYFIIIFRMIRISMVSRDIFGMIFTGGFLTMILFLVFQNIGMTIGLMPITGITLPFMSYGRSSSITAYICLGIVLNIGMRRKKINF